MRKALIAVVALVVIGAGIFFVFNKKGSAPAPSTESTPSTSNTNNTTQTPSSSAETKPAAATITYTDDGFSPGNVTVKTGDTVTVKNNSSHSMQFSSDPHPVHTGDKELNQQSVPAGGSITFTVAEKGTHGYHDHNDPSKTGTIVVE